MSVYAGLKIAAEGLQEELHLTLAFFGKIPESQHTEIAAKIFVALGPSFEGTTVFLDGEDMFGPAKDLRVRLARFADKDPVGNLAASLYEEYGNKEYPHRLHITSNKNPVDDDILFFAPSVSGCSVYLRQTGPEKKTLFMIGRNDGAGKTLPLASN